MTKTTLLRRRKHHLKKVLNYLLTCLKLALYSTAARFVSVSMLLFSTYLSMSSNKAAIIDRLGHHWSIFIYFFFFTNVNLFFRFNVIHQRVMQFDKEGELLGFKVI